jgi:hypothetical protein
METRNNNYQPRVARVVVGSYHPRVTRVGSCSKSCITIPDSQQQCFQVAEMFIVATTVLRVATMFRVATMILRVATMFQSYSNFYKEFQQIL